MSTPKHKRKAAQVESRNTSDSGSDHDSESKPTPSSSKKVTTSGSNDYTALLDKYGESLPVVKKVTEESAQKEANLGFRPKGSGKSKVSIQMLTIRLVSHQCSSLVAS